MKEEISQAFKHDLRSVNQEEHKFWKDLLHVCLEPDLDAFGSEEILKGEHLKKSSTPIWSQTSIPLALKRSLKVSIKTEAQHLSEVKPG